MVVAVIVLEEMLRPAQVGPSDDARTHAPDALGCAPVRPHVRPHETQPHTHSLIRGGAHTWPYACLHTWLHLCRNTCLLVVDAHAHTDVYTREHTRLHTWVTWVEHEGDTWSVSYRSCTAAEAVGSLAVRGVRHRGLTAP